MRHFMFFAKLSVALSLVGCTTVPLGSMLALSRIDFTTTRIQDMRVAVEIPTAISPREGGVHMEVVVRQGAREDKFIFRLAEDQPQIGMKGLLPFPQPGKRMHAYRLRDQDVITLVKLRSERLAVKAKGEQGSLSMGIAAKEFCRNGSLDGVALTVTTYVATSETKGFVVVSRDYDVRNDATIAASLATIPACKASKT